MKIEWVNYDNSYDKYTDGTMDLSDKKMLFMEEKGWSQTAKDIKENVLLGKNGQFRNVVGLINGKPVVFVMFGVEFSGEELRIYNIYVLPQYRNKGIGKQAIKDIMDNQNYFDLDKTYSRLVTSIFADNEGSFSMFLDSGLQFSNLEDGLINMERKL